MKATVTVIIPNYNRAEMLQQAVESVLHQTYPVDEILVCDDGSNDHSKEIIASLSAQYPQIRWIECGKNGRPSIPRNIGVRQAKGEWICFLDNDDYWEKDKLEQQFLVVTQKNAQWVCTNAHVLIGERIQPHALLEALPSTLNFTELLKENKIICSSILIRKSLLLAAHLFPEEAKYKAVEDYALWLKVIQLAKLYTTNSSLVYYRNNPNTSIRSQQENEYIMKSRVLLHSLAFSLRKGKWFNALPCLVKVLENQFYSARYQYRMYKSNA